MSVEIDKIIAVRPKELDYDIVFMYVSSEDRLECLGSIDAFDVLKTLEQYTKKKWSYLYMSKTDFKLHFGKYQSAKEFLKA